MPSASAERAHQDARLRGGFVEAPVAGPRSINRVFLRGASADASGPAMVR